MRKERKMRKLFLMIICLSVLALGGTAIAANYDHMLTKSDKVKKENINKFKKEKKKGPSEQAYKNANPNAKFKRYEDYTPKEKKKLEDKTWDQMDTDEKDMIEDKLKKEKEKLDDLKEKGKKLGEILKTD
jgi:hypothetical protein